MGSFSDFLLSNHLLNLRITTPAEIVMREIARKLGCTTDWSSPGAVERYEHLPLSSQFFITGNESKTITKTTMRATPAEDTIAPDFARVSSSIMQPLTFAQST
ncbi:MAG: hypothetical protein M3288_05560 [Thermoproteota archaeon]|nr:hypothetical protein [Thermoproteota archaeon]